MKKYLLMLAVLSTGVFTACYDDSALRQDLEDLTHRVETLEQKVSDDVQALRSMIDAINGNVQVSDATQVEDGWIISFTDGRVAHLTAGQTPIVGVTIVDGVYVWTVNGSVLTTADGKPLVVTEATPVFRLEDGKWFVSGDGKTWILLDQAAGGAFIKSIEQTSSTVVVTLADGTVLTLAKATAFRIGEGSGTLGVYANKKITVFLPEISEADFSAIYAEVRPIDASALITKAGSSDWTVRLTGPVFPNHQAELVVNPSATSAYGDLAVVTVTLILADGTTSSVSRVVCHECPPIEVKILGVEMSLVNISIQSQSAVKFAILALPAEEASEDIAADLVFADGKQADSESGSLLYSVTGLSPNKAYKIFVAGADAKGDLLDYVAIKEAVTEDIEGNVAIYNIGKNTATIHIKVPQSVKDVGNAIKWAYTSLPMYMMNQPSPDSYLLISNDEYYGRYFTDDTTIVIEDREDIYIWDEELQEFNPQFDAPVPGEPGVFLFGEFAIGESDWGWGKGFYTALFDEDAYYEDLASSGGGGGIMPLDGGGSFSDMSDQSKYWTGFNGKYQIDFEKPDELDAEVQISMNLKPKGGVISVVPDDKVLQWCFCLMDNETYQMLMMQYFRGKSSLMQWFVTSRFAYYMGNAFSTSGAQDLVLDDMIWANPGDKFHLCLVALGDEQGFTQKYYHVKFTMPQPTKPAPVIEVTAVPAPEGGDSAHNVWFNFKCITRDATEAYYACGYEKDFMPIFGNDLDGRMSYDSYRNPFSATDLELINSPEGLTLSFYSAPDMSNCLAAIAYNDEGTPSQAMMASSRTASENVRKIESPLFETLKGDWTATTTIHVYYEDYDWFTDTYNVVDKDVQLSSKVTIGGIDYPETLPEDVYDIYMQAGYADKAAVDVAYSEFKGYVDEFNTRTRLANRLLCQGLDLDYYELNEGYAPLGYKSAFDLFCSDRYNGYNSESPIIDFGPKWYLEVAEDGSIRAPYSTKYMVPASSHYSYWGSIVESYFAGCAYLGGGNPAYINEDGAFPVEVSSDGNTITVKPEVVSGYNFYPTMWTSDWSGLSCHPVVSNIVLTRGWSGDSPAAGSSTAVKDKNTGAVSSSTSMEKNFVFKARNITAEKAEKAEAQQAGTITVKPVNKESYEQGIRKAVERMRR